MNQHALAESLGKDPVEIDIEPKRTIARVGILEIDLNEFGVGTIKVNGKELRCTSLDIRCRLSEIPTITVEFYPI